ncbi:MAG: cation:dicarboxylate symporter family transporter, partial [Oliverpabstia sp.]
MKYFSKTKRFLCEEKSVVGGMDFIQAALEECGTDRKKIVRVLLLAEEILVKLVGQYQEKTKDSISIQVSSILGETRIHIKGKGDKLEIPESVASLEDSDDPEAEEVIRNIVLKAYQDDLDMKYRNGVNSVTIRVAASRYKQLILTIGALILGVLVGAVLKAFASQSCMDMLSDNLFSPVSTMFLNAVKFVVAPLVFFSIASCIGDYGDMKALGRIGGKVIGTYFATSFLAILIGTGVYSIFKIGDPALAGAVTDSASS